MEIHSVGEILAAHPLFKGLDPETLALFAGCARNEHFRAGETIYSEGEDANKAYLIREGDVAVEISAPNHEPLVVETVRAGEVLGWSWMVAPYKHMSDTRALNDVRAVSLDAVCMRGKSETNPALGYHMFQHLVPHMAKRFRALRLQLLDVYGMKKG